MSFFAGTIEGLPPTGFYAPDFLVEVEGEPLDPETKGDVLSLKVVMELEKMTSAEIQLSNWDDKTIWFKYSDRTGLYVGHRVHIQMGYADRLVSMLRGSINSLAPEFPESGSPTLSLGVLDKMQALKDRRPREGERRQFREMTDGQIAQEIAQRNGLEFDIDPGGISHAEVVQGDLDDAQFLLQRAKRIDYDCFIDVDPDTGLDKLRFGLPRDERAAGRMREHKFAWGESLRSFAPTLTMSNQVSKVTVRGWNPDTMEAVVGVAQASDIEGASGNTGPGNAGTAAGGREDVVIGASVQTSDEADELARSLLRKRAYEFITGKGTIIGLSDLRPGDNMTIAELGDRFSGTYYVTKVEHALGSDGYSTNFEVRKSYDGGERAMNAPTSGSRFGEAVETHFGLYGGLVTDNEDPEGRGRIRLTLAWIADDFITEWATVAQLYAGDGYGGYWIPEIGDQVVVAFMRGELRRPIVIGSLYSQQAIPHATRGSGADPKYFRTAGGHMLLMEDGSGRKIELVDATGKNSMVFDSEANSITIKAEADVNVEAGTNVSVKGSANVSVEATGNLTLKGAAIKIEATGTVTVSGATINLN